MKSAEEIISQFELSSPMWFELVGFEGARVSGSRQYFSRGEVADLIRQAHIEMKQECASRARRKANELLLVVRDEIALNPTEDLKKDVFIEFYNSASRFEELAKELSSIR